MRLATRSRKAAFWLLLGMFSVVFVEVPAGSSMFPFFTAWGLLVVFPLYLMHTVFLAGLAYRLGRPTFWTLYSAGILYGLYEAYITKVLWVSFRPEGPIYSFGGIALVETLVLILFLHPLLAFVVPLLFAESLCTSSWEVADGLPAKWKACIQSRPKLWVGFLMAFLGLMQFVNSPSIWRSFLSGVGNCSLLGLVIYWWRRSHGAEYSLRELLPGQRGMTLLSVLLLAWYLFWGVALRREAIPGVVPGQLSVWLLYLATCSLFWGCLRRSHQAVGQPSLSSPPISLTWRGFVAACLLATAVTTAARFTLFRWAAFQILILFTFYVVAGVLLLTGALRYALGRSQGRAPTVAKEPG